MKPAVMVVIRRELPRTSVAGPAEGLSHRSLRGFSFPRAPGLPSAKLHDSISVVASLIYAAGRVRIAS